MVPPILKPEEKELYLVRDAEIRREIAGYIATHIDDLVNLAETEGISGTTLAEGWRGLHQRIVTANNSRYSGQLVEILNAQAAGLVDKFAEMFEDGYRHEPDLSFIRENRKLPKDVEYYPEGLDRYPLAEQSSLVS